MHSKLKGNLAQTTVVLALQREDLNVFTELGDYSKIDLIAEKNGILKKIQVKYSGSGKDRGNISLNMIKSGPNGYQYTYTSSDVDWFVVYDSVSERLAWVRATDICNTKNNTLTIRTVLPKNNQTKGIHFIEDYSIDRFLNDF